MNYLNTVLTESVQKLLEHSLLFLKNIYAIRCLNSQSNRTHLGYKKHLFSHMVLDPANRVVEYMRI